jgi:hypothetical protein
MIELAIEVETKNDADNVTPVEILDALRLLVSNMEQDFDFDRFEVIDTILIRKDPRCNNDS